MNLSDGWWFFKKRNNAPFIQIKQWSAFFSIVLSTSNTSNWLLVVYMKKLLLKLKYVKCPKFFIIILHIITTIKINFFFECWSRTPFHWLNINSKLNSSPPIVRNIIKPKFIKVLCRIFITSSKNIYFIINKIYRYIISCRWSTIIDFFTLNFFFQYIKNIYL